MTQTMWYNTIINDWQGKHCYQSQYDEGPQPTWIPEVRITAQVSTPILPSPY